MTGRYSSAIRCLMQLLIILVFFFGGAEAKGIEAGLWGLGWDNNADQIKQTLEGQGFVLLDQGNQGEQSKWQRFGNGQYTGFPCEIKAVWQGERLTEINIESTEAFILGTDFVHRNLVAWFTEQYGQPRKTEGYLLKIYPAVRVDWAEWAVTVKGSPAFTVTLTENSPTARTGDESARSAKITVLFQKIADGSR